MFIREDRVSRVSVLMNYHTTNLTSEVKTWELSSYGVGCRTVSWERPIKKLRKYDKPNTVDRKMLTFAELSTPSPTICISFPNAIVFCGEKEHIQFQIATDFITFVNFLISTSTGSLAQGLQYLQSTAVKADKPQFRDTASWVANIAPLWWQF